MIDVVTKKQLDPYRRYESIYALNKDGILKIAGKSNLFSFTPVLYNDGSEYPILENEYLNKHGYFLNKQHNAYFKTGTSVSDLRDCRFKGFDYPYNALGLNMTDKLTMLKYGSYSASYLISEHLKYSFGVEIETSSGLVPLSLIRDLNVKSVRDGSLYDDDGRKAYGGEYVTGILRGDSGFIQLKKILSVLSKRTKINKTCSVHVHLGSIDFNKLNVVLLWKISQVLEDELYSMMPRSRRTRAHCSPMQNKLSFKFPKERGAFDKYINAKYDAIVRIISLGKRNSATINKAFNHPEGHYCGYDTSTPRYWWVNFVPALFNLKGINNYTIEFRIHSASTNYIKIRNWILILMGIVNVVENHQSFLTNNETFKLSDVMTLAYPGKHKYLNDYIAKRKQLFSNGNDLEEVAEYSEEETKEVKSLKSVIWE